MAHYYLGVISLIHNDYDTARAAFENSLFKVRDYASKDDLEHYKEAESNFALGYFGKGFCNLRLGKTELAKASFDQAVRIDPRLAPVINQVMNPSTNTLLFIDAGEGPQKAAKGWYNEESVFGPTPAQAGPVPPVIAMIDGKQFNDPRTNYSTVDTLAMAQERRWQDIDTLKKAKAVVGTGMMAAGTGVAAYGADRRDTGTALAGLGVALAGAALAASSQSDVRSWNMLPRNVYIIPATLTPGMHEISVQVGVSQSGVLQAMIKPQQPGIKSDNIFYFRLR
jgi:tetratricopeptide (TPR) repeat protein